MNKLFGVITADIIGSKKGVGNDENTKSILDEKLHILNKRIEELNIKTTTPFHSSRGDEVQVVCDELSSIPVLLRYLRYYCLPLKLRIGIGVANIDYFYSDNIFNEVAITTTNQDEKINSVWTHDDITSYIKKHLKWNDYFSMRPMLEKHYNSLNSWDMNGMAFYYARKALDNLKNDSSATTISFFMGDSQWTVAIETILSLIDLATGGWTESKWKSVQMYDEYGTYDKAAKILNLTKQAVQGNCERADWEVIKSAERNLSKIFDYIDKEYNETYSTNAISK